MNDTKIYLTESECRQLRDMVSQHLHDREGRDHPAFLRLDQELARANVLSPEQMPGDVVTMNSRVRVSVLDTGHQWDFVVSWPADADPDQSRISVLAPLGMAMLGCRKGQTVEWRMPEGNCTLRVEDVEYPPRANGALGPARRASSPVSGGNGNAGRRGREGGGR